MHKLLQRQLKRALKDEAFETENNVLLQSISDAYSQNEQTLKMLERSLFLTSNELNERNETLKNQLASMEHVQAQLKHSLGLLQATFDSTGEIVLVYDLEGELISFNSMGKAFFNDINLTEVTTWKAFLDYLQDRDQLLLLVEELKEDPLKDLSGTLAMRDTRCFSFRSLPQIQEGKLTGRVWCFHDVTLQKQHEATIQYQAYHDSLTGLPNRALLLDRIKHSLAIAKREKNKLAILFLDLDNFKKVNDSEGHEAGDKLLQEVVRRLQTRLREQDTLSRQGGDEFVILLENIQSENAVTSICQDILALLKMPFDIATRQHYVTASIGIAVYPSDDDNASALIRKADLAMYQSKAAGKNGLHFYSHEVESNALQQLAIEQALRKAISNGELHLEYQPKVDLASMQISSLEALCRWQRPNGDRVSPDVFIAIAEQTGLITDIGQMVITKTCQQIAKWNQLDICKTTVSINLSSLEFQSEILIKHLIDSLERFNIEGSQLIIELTESIFMEDKDSIKETMLMLNKLGITFALDDFGKGYSSFSYLQFLPLHYLKVDKAFLQDIQSNAQSSTIAKTIIDIGHNLGLSVIAEGIEDQFMLDYVTAHKCNIGQGFFLHKPMMPEAATPLLPKLLNE